MIFKKLNIASEKIRLYEDNYQILQNKRAKLLKTYWFLY